MLTKKFVQSFSGALVRERWIQHGKQTAAPGRASCWHGCVAVSEYRIPVVVDGLEGVHRDARDSIGDFAKQLPTFKKAIGSLLCKEA
jgi:hypothetical protein